EMPPELLLIPPVIDAPPAETVKAPAEVMLPEPVVKILPEVEIAPNSVIVNLDVPPDSILIALCVAPLSVSLMINGSVAVPALVRLKERALLAASVKSILPWALSAEIVFPALYACWRVTPCAFDVQV